MSRTTIALILTVLSGAVHGVVLDHQHGLFMRRGHQTLGAHHLSYTLIAIVTGAIAYRSWRIARK